MLRISEVFLLKQSKTNSMLYTGSLWEEIQEYEILRYLDVCVDGEFQVDKKDVLLKWKGSANQRVIDVQASLREGKAVLQVE